MKSQIKFLSFVVLFAWFGCAKPDTDCPVLISMSAEVDTLYALQNNQLPVMLSIHEDLKGDARKATLNLSGATLNGVVSKTIIFPENVNDTTVVVQAVAEAEFVRLFGQITLDSTHYGDALERPVSWEPSEETQVVINANATDLVADGTTTFPVVVSWTGDATSVQLNLTTGVFVESGTTNLNLEDQAGSTDQVLVRMGHTAGSLKISANLEGGSSDVYVDVAPSVPVSGAVSGPAIYIANEAVAGNVPFQLSLTNSEGNPVSNGYTYVPELLMDGEVVSMAGATFESATIGYNPASPWNAFSLAIAPGTFNAGDSFEVRVYELETGLVLPGTTVSVE